MTTPSRPHREIDGKGRTIRELLASRKYWIDYYQREYKWQPAKSAPRGRKRYEIEPIWVADSERHVEEFAHPSEFADSFPSPQPCRRPPATAQERQRQLR